MPRKIKDIAKEIRSDWKNVNYAAKPYLESMFALNDITDMYFADTAKSCVVYFLANAAAWKGPVAKRIKAELKIMCGAK